jgi:hypothetical protein
MSNTVREDWDSALTKLEAQRVMKAEAPGAEAASEEDEFEDDYIASVELEKASTLLKDCAILLEFITNPQMCSRITKRERGIVEKQLTRIYSLTNELDEAAEAFEDI